VRRIDNRQTVCSGETTEKRTFVAAAAGEGREKRFEKGSGMNEGEDASHLYHLCVVIYSSVVYKAFVRSFVLLL